MMRPAPGPMSGPPPGGPPPGGPPGGDVIKNNASMLNPADLAGMKQSGMGGSGGTVRDFLSKLGIDVEGPVQQLVDFGKKQLQGGPPMNKMKAIAGGAPGGPPPGPPPGGPPPGRPAPGGPPPMPQGGGGLERLLGQI